MPSQHSAHNDAVRQILNATPFIRDLGVEPLETAPGRCVTTLVLAPRHRQHDGFIHAGVQATMADHTAGAAAATLLAPDRMVLTAEFKINLLRPGNGERLCCCATVLKPGRTLSVVESEVFSESGDNSQLIAKATVTLAVLPRPDRTQAGGR